MTQWMMTQCFNWQKENTMMKNNDVRPNGWLINRKFYMNPTDPKCKERWYIGTGKAGVLKSKVLLTNSNKTYEGKWRNIMTGSPDWLPSMPCQYQDRNSEGYVIKNLSENWCLKKSQQIFQHTNSTGHRLRYQTTRRTAFVPQWWHNEYPTVAE